MADDPALDELTENAVLGGKLRLRQPRRGHRVGHDAILLAAATPARAGEHAVDLGAGVGAAGLALARRVEDVRVTLVEVDPELAALAADNAQCNELAGRAAVLALDAASPARVLSAAGLGAACAVRVLMNPPFNDPARQRASPDRRRRLAHSGATDALTRWIRTAAWLMPARGTLSLIWRADGLAEVLAALAPGFGGVAIQPVHGKPDEPAIRVLVRAAKGSRAPCELFPAFILNDSAGRPTAQAEAVLREGAALPLARL